MKTARNPSLFAVQSIEGINRSGGGFFDKLDLHLGQALSQGVGYFHIAGLTLTDDEEFRIAVQNILDIFDFDGVTVFAPPVRHQGAPDNFNVAVKDLTVGGNSAK